MTRRYLTILYSYKADFIQKLSKELLLLDTQKMSFRLLIMSAY